MHCGPSQSKTLRHTRRPLYVQFRHRKKVRDHNYCVPHAPYFLALFTTVFVKTHVINGTMALEATWGTLSPTNRCEKCIGLTIDCLRDQDVRHHASLADLKRSALSGCDLCHLFWRRLETDCQANAIETHLNGKVFASRTRTDTSILLRGEFHDMDTLEARMSARFGTNRDKILIWSGYESDQNVGTEVYSNLSVFALAGE